MLDHKTVLLILVNTVSYKTKSEFNKNAFFTYVKCTVFKKCQLFSRKKINWLCIFIPDYQMTYRYMDELFFMLAHSFSSEHIHTSLSKSLKNAYMSSKNCLVYFASSSFASFSVEFSIIAYKNYLKKHKLTSSHGTDKHNKYLVYDSYRLQWAKYLPHYTKKKLDSLWPALLSKIY